MNMRLDRRSRTRNHLSPFELLYNSLIAVGITISYVPSAKHIEGRNRI